MTEPTERDREMARGLLTVVPWGNETFDDRVDAVASVIARVRAEERERCAKIADDLLRDVARYRWLRANRYMCREGDPAWFGLSEAEADELVDDEMARESGG